MLMFLVCVTSTLFLPTLQISHQYTLTDEQGPAHKKTFFVRLKLGEEEYASSGPSIKKAQHAAADIALRDTKHKHPPPKPPKNLGNGCAEWNNSSRNTSHLHRSIDLHISCIVVFTATS